MTSECRCDETAATSVSSESYVQLPRRVVEQMTEMCRLFVMTAAQFAQPTSTANHVSFIVFPYIADLCECRTVVKPGFHYPS